MSKFKKGDIIYYEDPYGECNPFTAKVKKVSDFHPGDDTWEGPWLHIKKTKGFDLMHGDDVKLVDKVKIKPESEMVNPQVTREELFYVEFSTENIHLTRGEAEQLHRKLGELLC